MYSSNWFMTLYSGMWPTELVARIWDIYFCEGPEIMQKIALVVLSANKSNIACNLECFMELPFEEILMYIKMPWHLIAPDDLLTSAIEMKSISEKIMVYFMIFSHTRKNIRIILILI